MRVEGLVVSPDNVAKVVINERTGTVVMGENVRIGTIAIAHGNLSVQIKESAECYPTTAVFGWPDRCYTGYHHNG